MYRPPWGPPSFEHGNYNHNGYNDGNNHDRDNSNWNNGYAPPHNSSINARFQPNGSPVLQTPYYGPNSRPHSRPNGWGSRPNWNHEQPVHYNRGHKHTYNPNSIYNSRSYTDSSVSPYRRTHERLAATAEVKRVTNRNTAKYVWIQEETLNNTLEVRDNNIAKESSLAKEQSCSLLSTLPSGSQSQLSLDCSPKSVSTKHLDENSNSTCVINQEKTVEDTVVPVAGNQQKKDMMSDAETSMNYHSCLSDKNDTETATKTENAEKVGSPKSNNPNDSSLLPDPVAITQLGSEFSESRAEHDLCCVPRTGVSVASDSKNDVNLAASVEGTASVKDSVSQTKELPDKESPGTASAIKVSPCKPSTKESPSKVSDKKKQKTFTIKQHEKEMKNKELQPLSKPLKEVVHPTEIVKKRPLTDEIVSKKKNQISYHSTCEERKQEFVSLKHTGKHTGTTPSKPVGSTKVVTKEDNLSKVANKVALAESDSVTKLTNRRTVDSQATPVDKNQKVVIAQKSNKRAETSTSTGKTVGAAKVQEQQIVSVKSHEKPREIPMSNDTLLGSPLPNEITPKKRRKSTVSRTASGEKKQKIDSKVKQSVKEGETVRPFGLPLAVPKLPKTTGRSADYCITSDTKTQEIDLNLKKSMKRVESVMPVELPKAQEITRETKSPEKRLETSPRMKTSVKDSLVSLENEVSLTEEHVSKKRRGTDNQALLIEKKQKINLLKQTETPKEAVKELTLADEIKSKKRHGTDSRATPLEKKQKRVKTTLTNSTHDQPVKTLLKQGSSLVNNKVPIAVDNRVQPADRLSPKKCLGTDSHVTRVESSKQGHKSSSRSKSLASSDDRTTKEKCLATEEKTCNKSKHSARSKHRSGSKIDSSKRPGIVKEKYKSLQSDSETTLRPFHILNDTTAKEKGIEEVNKNIPISLDCQLDGEPFVNAKDTVVREKASKENRETSRDSKYCGHSSTPVKELSLPVEETSTVNVEPSLPMAQESVDPIKMTFNEWEQRGKPSTMQLKKERINLVREQQQIVPRKLNCNGGSERTECLLTKSPSSTKRLSVTLFGKRSTPLNYSAVNGPTNRSHSLCIVPLQKKNLVQGIIDSTPKPSEIQENVLLELTPPITLECSLSSREGSASPLAGMERTKNYSETVQSDSVTDTPLNLNMINEDTDTLKTRIGSQSNTRYQIPEGDLSTREDSSSNLVTTDHAKKYYETDPSDLVADIPPTLNLIKENTDIVESVSLKTMGSQSNSQYQMIDTLVSPTSVTLPVHAEDTVDTVPEQVAHQGQIVNGIATSVALLVHAEVNTVPEQVDHCEQTGDVANSAVLQVHADDTVINVPVFEQIDHGWQTGDAANSATLQVHADEAVINVSQQINHVGQTGDVANTATLGFSRKIDTEISHQEEDCLQAILPKKEIKLEIEMHDISASISLPLPDTAINSTPFAMSSDTLVKKEKFKVQQVANNCSNNLVDIVSDVGSGSSTARVVNKNEFEVPSWIPLIDLTDDNIIDLTDDNAERDQDYYNEAFRIVVTPSPVYNAEDNHPAENDTALQNVYRKEALLSELLAHIITANDCVLRFNHVCNVVSKKVVSQMSRNATIEEETTLLKTEIAKVKARIERHTASVREMLLPGEELVQLLLNGRSLLLEALEIKSRELTEHSIKYVYQLCSELSFDSLVLPEQHSEINSTRSSIEDRLVPYCYENVSGNGDRFPSPVSALLGRQEESKEIVVEAVYQNPNMVQRQAPRGREVFHDGRNVRPYGMPPLVAIDRVIDLQTEPRIKREYLETVQHRSTVIHSNTAPSRTSSIDSGFSTSSSPSIACDMSYPTGHFYIRCSVPLCLEKSTIRCPHCRDVYYCSEDHLSSDWNARHKHICH